MRPLPAILLLTALDGECSVADPPDWSLEDRAEECGIEAPPMPRCDIRARGPGNPQARIRCREAIEEAECEQLLTVPPECLGVCG